MKALYSLFAAAMLLCSAAASAQNRDKGVFVEMDFGYGATDDGYALFAPSVGYRFANRWSAGFRVMFESEVSDYTTLSWFGQYRLIDLRRFDVFAEGQVSYVINPGKWDGPGSLSANQNYAEAGVTFGASYRLWKGLRLTARYLYLGYSGSSPYRRSDGCWGDGGFVLDAGWNRLQVGLQYTF